MGTLIGRAFGYGSRLIIARSGASDYGLVALFFVGLLFVFLLFISSNFLSHTIFHTADAIPLIKISAFIILIWALDQALLQFFRTRRQMTNHQLLHHFILRTKKISAF